MRIVAATEFKAKCLELMDRVAERRETYVITKHGRAVAKLVPPDRPRRRSVLGCMADEMTIVGDLEKPAWSEDEWKEFERRRDEQASAWEEEWRSYGTISGRKTVGPPPRSKRSARQRKGGRRSRP